MTELVYRIPNVKTVNYDLARGIEGAKELKTSQFADAIIGNM